MVGWTRHVMADPTLSPWHAFSFLVLFLAASSIAGAEQCNEDAVKPIAGNLFQYTVMQEDTLARVGAHFGVADATLRQNNHGVHQLKSTEPD